MSDRLFTGEFEVGNKIRTLIIDDSALARDLLKKGLSDDPRIDVIGTASDVYSGRDKIVYNNPDVITLDIEMPKMDGIDFLKRLMPQHPVPVIIVSALAEPGAEATLDALQHGAVDFVLKPSSKIGNNLTDMLKELKEKVKIAADVDVSQWKRKAAKSIKTSSHVLVGTTDKVIAIGASTGGTVAIRNVVNSYPHNMPGTVIVQHMPPTFTRLFAESLDKSASVEVKEAEDNDKIITGRVLVAPGGVHSRVIRSGGDYRVRCTAGEKVNGHIPSVDVLYDSVAKNVGSNAVGVILTGMGRDGAAAMLRMRKAGARTLAQDEESSVVFGMPKEAYQRGGAERLVSIQEMTSEIVKIIREMR